MMGLGEERRERGGKRREGERIGEGSKEREEKEGKEKREENKIEH